MITTTLDYNDGETVLEGYVAYEESDTQKPLVLVAHDWTGRREFACRAAERVAGLGYVGFALDMYGKGIFGSDGDTAGNSALMGPYAADRALLRRRIRAALVAGRNVPQVKAAQVAAMGYCFGGMCVLELARSGADVLGVVSIHGIFAPGGAPNEEIRARVLCLHGHDDPMVPPEQVLAFQQEMSEAGADWQVHSYGGTMHAFTNPKANDPDFGAVYNERAKHRAHQSTRNFLAEIFA
ncbi:MAG: dienelactone hydrolase family protein [Gammaproteobacteria bacterium]|nr:dienelactone hydrolase family protein [Gammaproteobacteria bacterium]MDE0508263.1 dienelactone hydrolase family protein [Gammaproteobacteria bacterium]MXX07446.1 dienelactone hydrolase family protein [Gammaproteobacteria bacterium]MYC61067.1 dienelactone hydrolase family protein [Gammaproteobacteria bacterium]MYE29906.1 dienelactone hydrolase family protein [Gammaproteobacteria bacterium]